MTKRSRRLLQRITASRSHKKWSTRSQGTWPLVLLLLAAVAVPAACVLWFMTEAMRNEHLAVRGRLTAMYRGQLDALARRLDDYWQGKEAALVSAYAPSGTAAEVFAGLVRSGAADSVTVYDASGQVRYPVDLKPETTARPGDSGRWREAWRLEHQSREYIGAAAMYAGIARESKDRNWAAHALRAEARCLVKAGEDKGALAILASELEKEYGDTTDAYGNLIVPDVQLWALEEVAAPGTDGFDEILKALVARLEDYSDPLLAASQRRFLMQRLGGVAPDCPHFRTLEAEILAAEYLEQRGSSQVPAGRRRLRASGIEDVWELVSSDTSLPVIALLRQSRIFQEMESLIEAEMAVPDVTVKLVRSDAKLSEPGALLMGTAGEYLPDWQLALWLNGSDPFATAVDNRMAIYLCSGILAVLVIVALAALVAHHIGRQIRLTRLRNDLIATVSHELKTPLASIRALIETLLEGRYHDEAQHREYLQMAAKENERLSRLIDNFLAFSRMERNKRTFEFSEVPVDQIVTAAVDAVREKFQEPGARLDVEVGDGLPSINGDTDALTTALVDLLDNAHKYTEDDKHVVLRASANNGVVRLEVQDNGVGMSRRAARKVFDRFYQVDETLSRRAGGCGLGLSIVQFIVTAHGGSVGVTSELGQGSTFTITLPAAQTSAASDDERKR